MNGTTLAFRFDDCIACVWDRPMSLVFTFGRLHRSAPAVCGLILLAFVFATARDPAYPVAYTIGFTLTGLSLALTLHSSGQARRIQHLLAWLLALLALGSLLGAADWAHAGMQTIASRAFALSPDAALALFAAAVGLMLLARLSSAVCRLFVELLALAVLGIGAFDVVGHLFHFDAAIAWYAQVRMPLFAAFAILLAGAGLALSVPARGEAQPGHEIKIVAISAVIMVTVVVIGAALAFVMLGRQTEHVLRDSLALALQARTGLFAHAVEESMEAASARLQMPRARRFLRPQALDAFVAAAPQERERALETLRTALGAIAVVVADSHGHPIAAAPSATPPPTFRYRLPGHPSDELRWVHSLLLRTRIGVTAPRAGALTIAVDFPAPQVMPIILDAEGLGRTGVLFVCADVGVRVSCLPSRMSAHPLSVRWLRNGTPLPIHYALTGRTGVARSLDYRAREVIAAYAPIGQLGLGAVLKVDRDELYASMRQQVRRMLVVLLALVGVGVLLLRRQLAPLVRELLSEIEERRRAEGQLRKLSAAVDQSASMVLITDRQGVIEYVNPKVTQVTGYSAEELVGHTPRVLQSGNTPPEQYEALWLAVQAGQEWHGEFQNRKKNGELYWAYEAISPIRNADGVITHYLAVEEDVTARKEAEGRLSQLAHFDGLTGLPNRELFGQRLRQAMVEAGARGRLVALMFIDIDRFKVINDTLGHVAGDALLTAISERLTRCVRRGDTVARLGGDEFTVILADMAHADDAAALARKVLDVLRPPFYVNERELFVTASIGITLYPGDGEEMESLLKHADIAMYRAKACGRDNYQFYTAEMNAKAMERLVLENDLRHALERDEFTLYYQPQFDLLTGAIIGAEALIRWHHRKLGMVSPVQFIPLAEETGLIGPIGEWVVQAACAQIRGWRDAGLPRVRVTINLSARQFATDDLPTLIGASIAQNGIDPGDLGLELTEGLLMENTPAAIRALEALSGMGLELAIDDFGVGYSSLSYLRRFRIDVLKIDQSFVRDLHSPDGASLVDGIILLAHGLGLRVIAEGVETAEELAYLRARRCDAMQGYYYSRPLPSADFAAYLRAHAVGTAPAVT